MVRSRSDSQAEGGANLMPASVPDIARSLKLARLRAELTVPEASVQAGLETTVIEALESGDLGQAHDRIATLRSFPAQRLRISAAQCARCEKYVFVRLVRLGKLSCEGLFDERAGSSLDLSLRQRPNRHDFESARERFGYSRNGHHVGRTG